MFLFARDGFRPPRSAWIAIVACLCFPQALWAQALPWAASSTSTFAQVDISESYESYDTYLITGRRYTGTKRTNSAWLDSFIDLTWPKRLSRRDIKRIETRLKTAMVFSEVKASLEPDPVQKDAFVLVIYLDEKWTLIPVVRAVYGGGTPVRVVGIYDTHAFGRLVTAGFESRKYGVAPPGFVLFAKDPRYRAGRYYWATEFWRDFRRRSIYTRDKTELIGNYSTNAAIGRIQMLAPLTDASDINQLGNWRAGLDTYSLIESPSHFDPSSEYKGPSSPPDDLGLATRQVSAVKLMPTLLYDNIEADNMHLDGYRINIKGGPVLTTTHKTHTTMEAELYAFKLIDNDMNLGLRAFAGVTSYSSLYANYFLGGLDTVRGLPDGAIYGTRAAYTNAEARFMTKKYKYLWIQNIAFVDGGMAGGSWQDAFGNSRAASGVGIRLAIPQINRFVARIDYAWSIDGSNTQGLTAGFNQFFEPYKPLDKAN